jgi:uncharacterized protein (DUF58 family)
VLVVLGVLLHWAPAAVLGAGAIALVLLSLAFLFRPQGLTVHRLLVPGRVPKFEEAVVSYRLVNNGTVPVPAQRAEQRLGDEVLRFVLPRLRRGVEVERSFPLPTNRRGVFELAPFETTRQDPFGLVRRTRKFTGSDELWVYPQILPFRPLPAGFNRPAEGPTSDMAPQGSITFHRLREYVVGDDLRLVHWKSTARTGRLMVRHNVDTSQPFATVVVDLRPTQYTEDTFELALDGAASAVIAAIRSNGPVQVRLTDGRRAGDESTTEPQTVLDLLTAAEPYAPGSLEDALLALRRERGGTSLTVVTGAVTQRELAAASRLRRAYYRVIVLSIVEPGDEPVAAMAGSGVTVITASDADELIAGWNLESVR